MRGLPRGWRGLGPIYGGAEQRATRPDDPRHLAERQRDRRVDILKHVKRDNPEIPVGIISGHGNIEIAVAAINQGAYDFIEKPFNID